MITLNTDYYKKAVKMIKEKVKKPVFYVFSDDTEWCKQNLYLGVELIFPDDGNLGGYHVLEMMKNCKHNILANSSLSWWAGYLNNNPNKIIIAPEKFCHFEGSVDEDFLPKEWIKI